MVWPRFSKGRAVRCLGPGRLREAFRRASSRCGEGNFDVALAQQHQQSADGGRFSCSWTTRQDADFFTVGCLYGFTLLLGQMHVAVLLQARENRVPQFLAGGRQDAVRV